VQLMRPIADEAHVALAEPLGPSDCHVRGDRQRLRQILLNLLSNAVKYNRAGGNVWVTWMVDDDAVSITVRDDGPGIDEELQDRLFTPFDRLGAEMTPVDGTGVGLALTRSLAELMGGTVTVTSSPPNGSAFVVTLPVAAAPPAVPDAAPVAPVAASERDASEPDASEPHASEPHASEPDASDSARWTVLYVEDNEPNALVFAKVLELRPQWTLIHAALGALGVELARAHRPDLVFLDLHLPDLPGEGVLAALKDDPLTASTPVFILTADATPAHAEQLLQAGADRYLTKPLRVEEILGLLDARAAARAL
jgi:CheY-like chemotaxis protein/anti-sigma regulatory factor (Ser/Thr protein kinase)